DEFRSLVEGSRQSRRRRRRCGRPGELVMTKKAQGTQSSRAATKGRGVYAASLSPGRARNNSPTPDPVPTLKRPKGRAPIARGNRRGLRASWTIAVQSSKAATKGRGVYAASLSPG